MTERLLDVKELAAYLAVPVGWVYRQSEQGKLPVLKVGKYNRYRLESCLAVLTENGEAAQ